MDVRHKIVAAVPLSSRALCSSPFHLLVSFHCNVLLMQTGAWLLWSDVVSAEGAAVVIK